jgi:hypothetical protein
MSAYVISELDVRDAAAIETFQTVGWAKRSVPTLAARS